MADHETPASHLTNAQYYREQEQGRMAEDFNDRFLLTPPAVDQPTQNPFDATKSLDATLQSSAQLSKILEQNARAHRQNAHTVDHHVSPPESQSGSMAKELHLNTDFPKMRRTSSVGSSDSYSYTDLRLRSSNSTASLPLRVPSVRNRLHSTAGSVSPGSVISSPMLAAMLDMTPLPSPTMGPEEWRALARSRSRASSTSSRSDLPLPTAPQTSPRKKNYGMLHVRRKSSLSEDMKLGEVNSKDQARSVSDYKPDVSTTSQQRHISTGPPIHHTVTQNSLHREGYVGARRGIPGGEIQVKAVPSPAQSLFGIGHEDEPFPKRSKVEVWTAQSINSGATKNYETIRLLGQGTFSKVYLAVRQIYDRKDSVDYRKPSTDMAGVKARSRRLVAVKVVEPGPAGGADADRIEVSLKREVELMKKVQHPCIIHLKAFGTEPDGRALLVLNYCPGGDLFDLASSHLDVLTPTLVRRIFSELVSAVRFLHQKYIVHRDIKLENVLLNIPPQVHSDVRSWQKLDRAVITLTDLGLSRSIPPPPESPLLETRCGSEDYAAPEILMGQAYDGRQTDAWALGVLLYSLMEGRLPFDPLPGARGDPATLRARTPHRIARLEWAWVKYGDEDGDWDAEKGKELEGARQCVDALLKRNTRRKPLAEIREWSWVKDGIQVDGGLRWVEEEGT